jgi:endonuclease/exonuclease/phosphatase family metal-dependent hydrolase
LRIIAWNANYNRHRRSFEADAAFLHAEDADIIIVSETARPTMTAPRHLAWLGLGAGPGLAVMARNGWTISAHANQTDRPALFGAFHVHGPVSFNLLAVWPVQVKGGPCYSESLAASLSVNSGFLKAERTLMAGDFNSSPKVAGQRVAHSKFVRQAAALGLVSLYHHQTGTDHGHETVPTYRHNNSDEHTFHLDYCFLSESLLGAAKLSVLNGAAWHERSDHFPLLVDLVAE